MVFSGAMVKRLFLIMFVSKKMVVIIMVVIPTVNHKITMIIFRIITVTDFHYANSMMILELMSLEI